MKRPIAELRTLLVRTGAEAEWLRDEQEVWQILRRKPGYATHHLYRASREHEQRLVYSEWESKKALDGARQFLGGTPLGRRLQATLSAGPERMAVELLGPVTSTKGLDLPDGALAATAIVRLPPSTTLTPEQYTAVGKQLMKQTGHLTQVLFRGFDQPAVVGVLCYWQDTAALERAIAALPQIEVDGHKLALAYLPYEPLRA